MHDLKVVLVALLWSICLEADIVSGRATEVGMEVGAVGFGKDQCEHGRQFDKFVQSEVLGGSYPYPQRRISYGRQWVLMHSRWTPRKTSSIADGGG